MATPKDILEDAISLQPKEKAELVDALYELDDAIDYYNFEIPNSLASFI